MKSLILEENGLKIKNVPLSNILGTKLINFSYASINHRDLWITKGQYSGIKFPVVLGSDGAGICEGKEVLLNPSVNWVDDNKAQPKQYEIIGLPNDGSFREAGYFSPDLIHSKPEHLSLAEASALPLAGLTAYRVLISRCQLKKQDKVLVTGIGGGVALFAAQFAMAMGCEVWVSSGDNEKLHKAKQLGISGGVNYKTEEWNKKLLAEAGNFDVVIDSAGGAQFALLASLCNPGARLGIYGGTLGKLQDLSQQVIFWKQLSIFGSTMGNHKEFAEMLDFVTLHKIIPVIDSIYPIEEFKSAFERMEKAIQFGKIVLQII